MKKVFVIASVGMLLFASCKKDYTCTITVLGISSTAQYPGLNKSDAKAAQTACEAATGTWATK